MGALADAVCEAERLLAAWRQVRANDLEDGIPSSSVERFVENEDERLAELGVVLRSGAYEPDRLTPVQITIGDKRRELHIPSVRDRIVARAILTVVGPLVDPYLGPAAFAYRPGLGVVDAVQQVTAFRSEGLGWVLRTDIRDCFPSLPKEVAERRFAVLVDDDVIVRWVGSLIRRTFRVATGGIRTLSGVPQGCPLSPCSPIWCWWTSTMRSSAQGSP